MQLPATAQAILAARIDRLAPEDKRLLQAAAVIGKDVPFALLEAIAEEPEDGFAKALRGCRRRSSSTRRGFSPTLEYTFKHALTHEVAYGGLLQERRRALHGRIVEAIERLHADRLAEHTEHLAHHSFRAESWDQAAAYLRRPGGPRSAPHGGRRRRGRAGAGRARTSAGDRAMLELAIDLRIELPYGALPPGRTGPARRTGRRWWSAPSADDDRHRVVRAKNN